MIPTFIMMTKIGLYNNIWAVILPQAFSIWNIILTKTYFNSIPESLREAAKIDGANNFHIMMKIYMPIAKPIIAVICIYTIVNTWNSWFKNAEKHKASIAIADDIALIFPKKNIGIDTLPFGDIDDCFGRLDFDTEKQKTKLLSAVKAVDKFVMYTYY